MLNQTQIDEYNRVGAIVVPDVLTQDEVLRLRHVTDEFVERARAVAHHDEIYDLEDSHTPQQPRVRRIKSPHLHHPRYGDLVRHAKIISVLKALWGPNIRFDTAKLNMKSAGFGAAVEWHQDWAFYPHTNDDLAAVGIMMDDMELANGPLMIIPGSHKGPVFDHHADGRFCGAMDPATSEIDYARAIPLTGNAGSITVHHVRAVHGSAPNTSNKERRLLLLQYRAADAWHCWASPAGWRRTTSLWSPARPPSSHGLNRYRYGCRCRRLICKVPFTKTKRVSSGASSKWPRVLANRSFTQHNEQSGSGPNRPTRGRVTSMQHAATAGARTTRWQAVGASTIGTIVEWYDFYLYGTAAALVLNKVFFPNYDPLVGILASYATFAVGYLVRPFGGVLFGHFGDKYGRKPVLIATLLLMGFVTAAIGVLPTYGAIGIAAPIMLLLLRLLQGLGAGAEYAGAILFAAEYGSTQRRGFFLRAGRRLPPTLPSPSPPAFSSSSR